MKLYTEEEIRNAMIADFIVDEEIDNLINKLTPIELPTDEQIRHFAFMNYSHLHDENKPFIDGMKCMRDKIQGGNK